MEVRRGERNVSRGRGATRSFRIVKILEGDVRRRFILTGAEEVRHLRRADLEAASLILDKVAHVALMV